MGLQKLQSDPSVHLTRLGRRCCAQDVSRSTTHSTEVIPRHDPGVNTYALGRDGSLWAWGDDAYGQIGNTASARTQATPLKVNLAGVKSVGAGGTHALALTSDGTAWAWGNNNTGQLGDGGVRGKTCPTPVKVTALAGATALIGG